MKTKLSVLLLVTALITNTGLPQTVRTCGTMNNLERLKNSDPQLESRMAQLEQFTQQWINENANKRAAVIYTIPVVVHVVYNGSSENISDAQVQSQIAVLTEDFRRLNADKTNTPSAFSSIAADVEIEFCLATKDPAGNATTGITRTSTSVTQFYDNDGVKFNSSGGKDAWATDKYLNLWSCDLGTGLLGYAQFPGGSASTDGVVINYRYFGRNGSAQAPFNKGRTATHEVGHWLNLYHIWGDDGGACTGSDNVTDTPNQAADSYGCPTYPKTDACSPSSPGVMFMNYLDYTDDACMNMFSSGQSSRMRALFGSGGARASLLSSTGCGGTTTVNYCASKGNDATYEWIAGVAIGTINKTSASNGGYVDFTATSTNLQKGTSYSLTLTPGFASSTYNEYWRIWVDLNQDKDFDDAGEMVYDQGTMSSSAVTGSLTIPTSATSGTTRMRVSMKYNAASTQCEAFAYGEVEDYSVNLVTATATCNTPGGLSASSITASGATLNWTAVSGAGSYNVRYKSTSSTTWTNTTSATNSKSISGLTASTTYEFQVQTVCSGSSSSYSASSNFTTGAATSTTKTLTIGTGTGTTSYAPYGTYYMDERTQFVITKTELVNAGYTSTTNVLKSLAFYVTTASSQTMNGFTIKIRHTTATYFSSTSFMSSTGMTTVYSGNAVAVAGTWNTYTFSTPFSYNGTDNLLIEICWNNSTYTSNSTVTYTATSAYRTMYYRADVASGGVCANTTGSRTYNRPNMRMLFSSSTSREFFEPTIEEPLTDNIVNPLEFGLSIYPNPVNNTTNVLIALPQPTSNLVLKIMDCNGKLILSNIWQTTEGDIEYPVNVENIANGIYQVAVYSNNFSKTQKLVIMK